MPSVEHIETLCALGHAQHMRTSLLTRELPIGAHQVTIVQVTVVTRLHIERDRPPETRLISHELRIVVVAAHDNIQLLSPVGNIFKTKRDDHC